MGIMGIIVGILILSVMMIVHELGHYLTGRKLGFTIEEFSIFMGPVLFSWERNGIKYSIKLFPIGASVRFAGEFSDDEPGSADPGHFYNRPLWARATVIATGPALNLLSGILAFFIMFVSFGYTIPLIASVPDLSLASEAGIEAGDRILEINGTRVRTTLDYSAETMFIQKDEAMVLVVRSADQTTRTVTLNPAYRDAYRLGITVTTGSDGRIAIESVDPDSNNGNPVLQAGDIILSANGASSTDMQAFSKAVANSKGEPMQVSILRDGSEQTVTMQATRYSDPVDTGIYFASSQAAGPAIGQSFQWSWSIVKVTFKSIGAMFSGTIMPQDTLSGPVGVVSMISDVVSEEQPFVEKIYQLLWMFAIISVTLGFMNLLPIPPLDGHHLILIVVEAIRGKRLPDRVQNLIGMVGIAFIILLALTALMFDVLRLAGK